MIFDDGSEYIELAVLLAKEAAAGPHQDAKLRSAISRAYYAAFLRARYYLTYKAKDLNIPRDGTAHTCVREQFRSTTEAIRQEIWQGLDDLRKARNQADYQANYKVSNNNVRFLVIQARHTISLINSL